MYVTLVSLFTMAEGDSSSSFSETETETDSILSGSACYSTKVSEDSDVSSVASLSLPVPEETIQPYLFEPETLSSSESEETLEVVGHPSKERIGLVRKQCKDFAKCVKFLMSGASVVVARQCQRQENLFVARKSTRLKRCWLMIRYQLVSHSTRPSPALVYIQSF